MMSHPLFTDLMVEKKDFREAPLEKNKIKKARFSTACIGGLLDKYDIAIE